MGRAYSYVGEIEVLERIEGHPPGTTIRKPADLERWLEENDQEFGGDKNLLVVTFTVSLDGVLTIADPNSKHVACASGGPVLTAGEIGFRREGDTIVVAEVTNQSTGFCPEPSTWPVLQTVFDNIPLEHPGEFTRKFVFRRCEQCGQKNIVKEGWSYCGLCDAELPAEWNFDRVGPNGEPIGEQPKTIAFYRVSDEYGDFSNFAPYPIQLKNKTWLTSEHYFQAQKFAGTTHEEEIRRAKKAFLAARMGRDRSRKIRRDWESVKDSVMREAVRAKFSQHEELGEMLLSTADAELVEHTANDTYWADGGDGSGKNMLGRILMEVREELRSRG